MNKPPDYSHLQMKGEPSTWGPDEKGCYLAGGTCRNCAAQLIGEYVKSNEKPPHPSRCPSRDAAVVRLHLEFESHVCDPERIAAIARDGWPKPVAIPWTPLSSADERTEGTSRPPLAAREPAEA